MAYTHHITLPGTTFEAKVNHEEVDIWKLCVDIFRTNGGKMTTVKGKSVPNEKTKHLFPVVTHVGLSEDYS